MVGILIFQFNIVANNVMAIIRANGANDALMLVNKPGNREILVMALKFLANLTHTGIVNYDIFILTIQK